MDGKVNTITLVRDDDAGQGAATVTITVDGAQVTETVTLNGVADKETHRFAGAAEADRYLHDRRVALIADGYHDS
ncbi:hypothetical protein [Bailinhaonella thermotolerans]|nr:hypothetical protein [Bailinhaonella thermotolerans]